MSRNERILIGGIEFDIFRMESTQKDGPAFPLDRYKLNLGDDGRLYSQNQLSPGVNPANTQLLPYAAKFIVTTSGAFYLFHNSNDTDTQMDRRFLFAEPEIIAAGSIVINDGYILAMTPANSSGFPDEKALIRFLRLLRQEGYENYPLVLREADGTFGEVLKFHREHGFSKTFDAEYSRRFKKHLESIDHSLVPREADCVSEMLRLPGPRRLFRL